MAADWMLDRTVNVEGAATAVAAMGAASAYVINVVQRWRWDRSDKRRRDRGSLILEFAQRQYQDGVTESAIIDLLTSDAAEPSALRAEYGVKQHNTSTKTRRDIERHLTGLFYDRLLELDGPDLYRLYGSRWVLDRQQSELERQEREATDTWQVREAERAELLKRKVELRAALRSRLLDDAKELLRQAPDRYETKDLVDVLVEMEGDAAAQLIEGLLDEWPADRRSEIICAVTDALRAR